jgi:hypothetical protein
LSKGDKSEQKLMFYGYMNDKDGAEDEDESAGMDKDLLLGCVSWSMMGSGFAEGLAHLCAINRRAVTKDWETKQALLFY